MKSSSLPSHEWDLKWCFSKITFFFPWRAKYCQKMWLSVKQPELVIWCFLAGPGLFYRIKLFRQIHFLKRMNEITHGRSNEGWKSVTQTSTSFLHLLRLCIWSTLWEVIQKWSSVIISENVSVGFTSCKKHIDKSLALKIKSKEGKEYFQTAKLDNAICIITDSPKKDVPCCSLKLPGAAADWLSASGDGYHPTSPSQFLYSHPK